MTIAELDKIDLVSEAADEKELHLVIVDDLEWNDPQHSELLTNKLNNYASFVMSGQHKEIETQSDVEKVVIHLAHIHPLPDQLHPLMEDIARQLKEAEIGFAVSPISPEDLPDSQKQDDSAE